MNIKYQVRELKNKIKVFEYRYRVNGRQTTKSFRAKSATKTAEKAAIKELENFAKEIEAKKTLGVAKDESSTKFSEYSELVFKIHDRNLSEQTKQNRQYYLSVINEYIGNVKLKNLTATRIESFLVKMSETKSDQVLSKYKQIINIVMDHAFSKDLIPINPMMKVRIKISQKNIKEVQPIDIKELEKYLEIARGNKKYYFTLLLMLYTGMRVGEALALQFDDWDFERNIIHITKNRKRNGKIGPVKKDRPRTFPIHEKLKELYDEVKTWHDYNKEILEDDYEDNNLFIAHEDGQFIPYSAFRQYLRRLDKTGIKIRPHQLRHTFATLFDDINLKDLQAMGGWKDVDTLINVYQAHKGYKTKTIKTLNEKFSNIKNGNESKSI
ncbi:site-specific integrase [Mycoplasmatota bacterium]|nr:site-specific integrase [Mycoplasmatota bacterium]